MYNESEKQVLRPEQSLTFVNCKCENPYFVYTRSQRRIAVPCGKCCACLQRRRQGWSKRLIDESEDYRNLHSFGFTFTYDMQHVPFLFADELEYLKKNEFNYHVVRDWYFQPNKSHSYIDTKRGCWHEDIKTDLQNGSCVGIAQPYDIDMFLRKYKRSLERLYYLYFHDKPARSEIMREFCPFIVRYFITSDYGETDFNNNNERKRCGMPHYHGIIYIQAKTEEQAEEIRQIPNLLNNIQSSCENECLNCWEHSKRRWDAKKQIYYGKDIHKFGSDWGSYLGKYINKDEESQFRGAKGVLYVPIRVFCSRQNKKYFFGSIGMSYFRPSIYREYMTELDYCVKHDCKWSPTFNENGFRKALPLAYKRYLLQNYFQFKFSELSQYIYQANFLQRHPDCFRNVLVNVPDENDPFGLRTKVVLAPRYIQYNKDKRKQRSRHSISCLPKENEEEEMVYIEWFDVGVKAFENYLAFAQRQTDLYINEIVSGFPDDNQHCVYYDSQFMPFTYCDTDKGLLGVLRELDKQRKAKCADIKKKAYEKKHLHEIRNKYVV